jgi:hypothetical protein
MHAMPDIGELRDLQCVNGCYTDIFGNTIWSPTRPGQVATFAEVLEMKFAPPRKEAAKAPVVVGKPKLTRKEHAAMDPSKRLEVALSGKYEFVD